MKTLVLQISFSLIAASILFLISVVFTPQVMASSTATFWSDSYSVDGKCYCDSSFDHSLDDISQFYIDTPDGSRITYETMCNLLGEGRTSGRTYYNDLQCGNGPANDAIDETQCPEIAGSGGNYNASTCDPDNEVSRPLWDLSALSSTYGTGTYEVVSPSKTMNYSVSNNSSKNFGGETVYRFYRPDVIAHFYTTSLSTREAILSDNRFSAWNYEGATFSAVSELECTAGATPVHQFYNPIAARHFYTINQSEYNTMLTDARFNSTWRYEGYSFCAYPNQATGREAISRFYNSRSLAHVYVPGLANATAMNNDARFNAWQWENSRKPVFYVPDLD